jgi:hypothetical protein
MCARRFLVVIFVLTLLVAAVGFAIYQWGGDVLLSSATPSGHFQASAAGGAPDYSQPGAWIASPQLPNDPSRWQPEGAFALQPRGRVATFYVHPTTYLRRDRWNAPLEPGGDSETRTRLFVQSQASVFTPNTQVWAPRYRQAAYGAFLLDSVDAQRALDLAYSDVAAAFDEFVKQVPASPIILAGHSQGALHLERLLREKVAGKPIARRVVAAYLVGWPISITADLPKLGLPACRSWNQSGCILSWMTFGSPANPDLILGQWEKTKGLNGGVRRQEDILCVNPVTGDQRPDPRGGNGALVPSADFTTARVSEELFGTRCEHGLLVVDGTLPPVGAYVLPGNNYHVYDYALFWGSIRRDAMMRIAAWRP